MTLGIDVDKDTTINLGVIELDLVDHDPVGDTVPLNIMTSGGVPGVPISLKTNGQIRFAKIALNPVNEGQNPKDRRRSTFVAPRGRSWSSPVLP